MKNKTINCWEYMKCGREPGGKKAKELGVCPAASDPVFNGLNQGINSGRMCWLVAGTFCKGKQQGTFARKKASCMECEFYKKVHAEEGTTKITVNQTDIFAFTHTGHVRESNEDRYFIRKLDDGSVLMAVADGMGGEVAGDYAAEITAGKLAGITQIEKGREEERLALFATETDLAIADKAEKEPELEGMGTTIICVLLRDGFAHWVHVGDSRLYLLQNEELIQLTRDQTFARFLLDEGEITEEEFLTHKARHFLEQSIGCGHCEPETGCHDIKSKDLLVLSTDGLHNKMTASTMASIINARADIESGAKDLVKAALDAGGDDNITILIAESA